MEAAVSGVLDHLEDYRAELISLMTERFQRYPPCEGRDRKGSSYVNWRNHPFTFAIYR